MHNHPPASGAGQSTGQLRREGHGRLRSSFASPTPSPPPSLPHSLHPSRAHHPASGARPERSSSLGELRRAEHGRRGPRGPVRVEGLGFGVWDLGFGVWGLGLMVLGVTVLHEGSCFVFRVSSPVFRASYFAFRVSGSGPQPVGFRVQARNLWAGAVPYQQAFATVSNRSIS